MAQKRRLYVQSIQRRRLVCISSLSSKSYNNNIIPYKIIDNSNIILSIDEIKKEAQRLGFFACGAAKAEKVDEIHAQKLKDWVEKKCYAGMQYMANYLEKRLDPTLLVPGTKTILTLAMNYAPAKTMSDSSYKIAFYAYGKDYHDIMKLKLRKLAAFIENQKRLEEQKIETLTCNCNATNELENQPTEIRFFVDTAPVLERYWAQKSGIGWIGKNHQLIIPKAGTMFFLGEIFLPFTLDRYDTPMKNRCGNCQQCIKACPTNVLIEGQDFNSDKCLSYQLIENRAEISVEAQQKMGNTIYGCDKCQTACPWNKFAIPNSEPDFQPIPELFSMTKEDWHNLNTEQYRQLFKGSAVKRAKFEGIKRNIEAAQKAQE